MGIEDKLAYPGQQPSPIRELLKHRVEISFGGGYPPPECFPVERITQLRAEIEPEYLQYGATEPLPEFNERLRKYLEREIGIRAEPDEISVGSGSQAILATLAATLISPGQTIVVDAPTYLGALGAFRTQRPKFITIPMTETGPDLDVLRQALTQNNVQFYYTVPNFGNPTGVTHDLKTREEIVGLAQKTGTLIVEDDPYGLLRYQGKPLPTLHELSPDHTAYIGTASKTIAPDMRTAWLVAPLALVDAYNTQAGAIQLYTSQVNQLVTARFLDSPDHFRKHIEKLRTTYGERLNTMLRAFEEMFPTGVTWTKPEGGMFIWISGLPTDIQSILNQAVTENVVFVPGTGFYANEPVSGTARFNFSNAKPEVITEGVRRIARILEPYY